MEWEKTRQPEVYSRLQAANIFDRLKSYLKRRKNLLCFCIIKISLLDRF